MPPFAKRTGLLPQHWQGSGPGCTVLGPFLTPFMHMIAEANLRLQGAGVGREWEDWGLGIEELKALVLPFNITAQNNPSIQHANVSAQFFDGDVRRPASSLSPFGTREEPTKRDPSPRKRLG